MIDEQANVRVASPYSMPEAEIMDFIREKAKWIFAKIKEANKHQETAGRRDFDHGHQFLFLGCQYTLTLSEDKIRRSRIDFDRSSGWRITVPEQLPHAKRRSRVKEKMVQWYRRQAEEILGGRIFHYARLMGVEPKRIAIRTQKRLWGCCDYNTQTIHINWQIILSPLQVIDYVIVHELCHLTVPNHSKRFWNRVEKFMPEFRQYRKWLKTNHYEMMLP